MLIERFYFICCGARIEGQVSKLASLIKNFLPELDRRKATCLRLFESDENKTICSLSRINHKKCRHISRHFYSCCRDKTELESIA